MSYRGLMMKTFKKCVQSDKKFSVGSRATLGYNIFRNHSDDALRRNPCRSKHEFGEEKMLNPLIVPGVLFTGLFSFFKKEDDEDPSSEIIMSIKRAILLIQKEEYAKAEQMLHVALRQAQTLQHYDGITYIYDVMANLAFDLKDYKKAETLFVTVLQRIIGTETEHNDLRVIHISLKLAVIYNETGDLQKAEDGYKFCLEKLSSRTDSQNEDAVALLGLTLEYYASMLFVQKRYVEALKFLYEAYDVSVLLNGEEHEQTLVLLNDLGAANCMTRQYDKAIEHLTKAEEIGKKFPDMVDLAAIHINLGYIYIQKGLYDEAKKYCNEGKRTAKYRKDKNGVIEAEKCINEIKKLTSQ